MGDCCPPQVGHSAPLYLSQFKRLPTGFSPINASFSVPGQKLNKQFEPNSFEERSPSNWPGMKAMGVTPHLPSPSSVQRQCADSPSTRLFNDRVKRNVKVCSMHRIAADLQAFPGPFSPGQLGPVWQSTEAHWTAPCSPRHRCTADADHHQGQLRPELLLLLLLQPHCWLPASKLIAFFCPYSSTSLRLPLALAFLHHHHHHHHHLLHPLSLSCDPSPHQHNTTTIARTTGIITWSAGAGLDQHRAHRLDASVFPSSLYISPLMPHIAAHSSSSILQTTRKQFHVWPFRHPLWWFCCWQIICALLQWNSSPVQYQSKCISFWTTFRVSTQHQHHRHHPFIIIIIIIIAIIIKSFLTQLSKVSLSFAFASFNSITYKIWETFHTEFSLVSCRFLHCLNGEREIQASYITNQLIEFAWAKGIFFFYIHC